MLLTDGGTDNAEEVFKEHNWPNKTVTLFVFFSISINTFRTAHAELQIDTTHGDFLIVYAFLHRLLLATLVICSSRAVTLELK